MVESYRVKSKLATAISFLAAFIVYVGKNQLAAVLPEELAYLAPVIVLIAGYIATQGTENKRVDVAEQIVHEQYAEDNTESEIESEDENIIVNLTLDGQDIISDDSEDLVDEDGV